MSDALGTMVVRENEGEVFLGRQVTQHQNMSEDTMKAVDKEVAHIIDTQYALGRRLLEENRDKVEVMTKALLEWETIDANQIDDIMSGQPPRPPKPVAAKPQQPSDERRQQGRGLPHAGSGGERLSAAHARSKRGGLAAPFCFAGRPLVDGHRQRHRGLLLRRRALPRRQRAIDHGLAVARGGRRLVDVGGESTRPARRRSARRGSSRA
jgi:hypothetical protein